MKFKNYLFPVLCFVVLLTLFLAGVSNMSHAQGTPNPRAVTVDNAPDRPIPITGSVTIPTRVVTCPDERCPASTLNANDRNAFQERVQFEIPAGLPIGGTTITVPAGKRLVIEFVAGNQVLLQQFQQSAGITLRTVLNGQEGSFPLLLTRQATIAGTDTTLWISNQQTRIYADPPSIRIEAARTPSGGVADVDVSISGYLVEL